MPASTPTVLLGKAKESLKDWVSAIKEVSPETGPAPVPENAPAAIEPQVPSKATIISKGTTIIGDIHITGSFESHGACTGDISASQTVSLSGEYTGNVCGAQIVLSNAVVKGNVLAQDSVFIDTSTQITGDIQAMKINTAGRVKGSIRAAEYASVQKSAVILGDIYTARISIEAGALLTGRMEISEDSSKRHDSHGN